MNDPYTPANGTPDGFDDTMILRPEEYLQSETEPEQAETPEEMTEEAPAEQELLDETTQPEEVSAQKKKETLPEFVYAEGPYIPPRAPKKKSAGRKAMRILAVVGKYVLGILLALAIALGGLLGYLTMAEYNPAYAENAERGSVSVRTTYEGQSLRILTFNTGFGALGEDADFFMDGGDAVTPSSENQVVENMRTVESILKSAEADILLLQEVDTDADRSYHRNQWLQYEFDLAEYESRFAYNYSCRYVPYPVGDPIGEVHSGIATFSRYDISSATRYSLPCPFSWPTRVANLKRCMLVTRIPIKDNDDCELVVVNVHLEAYDDGEGKAAQMAQVLKFLQEEYAKGNYVICGGDFNQAFPGTLTAFPIKDASLWVPGTLEALPEGWNYAYDQVVPSCRLLNQPLNPLSTKTQYYVIDGYIVSPNVTVDKVEALDLGFAASDHNPVVINVTLNSNLTEE